MSDKTLVCPYCGGLVPEGVTICPDCQEDLSGLLHLKYAHAMQYNEALTAAREGRLDEARAKLYAALEHQADFVPAHVLLAKVEAQQRRWPAAQAAVTRALELAPEDETVRALAERIAQAAAEEEASRQARLREAERVRQSQAAQYYATYQRDLMKAFGVGFGIASFLGLIAARLFGGKKRGRDA